jgi:hypothetical protein
MDVSDCPSIAICTGGQDHACHIVPSLEDAQTLCRTGTAEHLTDRNSFQYQGPSMKHLAAVSSMVATVKGTDCFAILSVKVPGVLENWPHVLFASRVHIAYQAWFLLHHARSGQSFTLICKSTHPIRTTISTRVTSVLEYAAQQGSQTRFHVPHS